MSLFSGCFFFLIWVGFYKNGYIFSFGPQNGCLLHDWKIVDIIKNCVSLRRNNYFWDSRSFWISSEDLALCGADLYNMHLILWIKKKVTIGINCFCQMDLSTFNLSLVGFSLTLHDLRWLIFLFVFAQCWTSWKSCCLTWSRMYQDYQPHWPECPLSPSGCRCPSGTSSTVWSHPAPHTVELQQESLSLKLRHISSSSTNSSNCNSCSSNNSSSSRQPRQLLSLRLLPQSQAPVQELAALSWPIQLSLVGRHICTQELNLEFQKS